MASVLALRSAAQGQTSTQRAKVNYSNGQISIDASNSSLNQILHDISRLTGMTITGGVTDERVFGTYGPADTSTVLVALLNGTGSNVMIVEDARKLPRELVLTPRQGGPTPPNPNAGNYEDQRYTPQQFVPPVPNQPAPQQNQPAPNQPPPNGFMRSTPVSPYPPTANTTPPPAADTTTQQPVTGVKTPQQIYEQLMKLQQQQQKPPP